MLKTISSWLELLVRYKYNGKHMLVTIVPSPTYPDNIITPSHTKINEGTINAGNGSANNTPIKVPAPFPPLKP